MLKCCLGGRSFEPEQSLASATILDIQNTVRVGDGRPDLAGVTVAMAGKSDIFLVYNLVDPSGELPESEVGLRCAAAGLQVLETDTREVVSIWPWEHVMDVDSVVDAENPEHMELLILQIKGEEFQFECDDSNVVITELGAARRAAGLELSGAPARQARQVQDEVEQKIGVAGAVTNIANILAPKKSVVILLLTLCFGYVVFSLVLNENKANDDGAPHESWTVIDGIYFAILTMTTVGYGDIVPRSESGIIATTVFVIFSVSAVGICISEI